MQAIKRLGTLEAQDTSSKPRKKREELPEASHSSITLGMGSLEKQREWLTALTETNKQVDRSQFLD